MIRQSEGHRSGTTIEGEPEKESHTTSLLDVVREMRNRDGGIQTQRHRVNRLERDSSWVQDYMVQAYGSVTCWQRDGKDPSNLDRLVKKFVRCSQTGRTQGFGGKTGCGSKEGVTVRVHRHQDVKTVWETNGKTSLSSKYYLNSLHHGLLCGCYHNKPIYMNSKGVTTSERPPS